MRMTWDGVSSIRGGPFLCWILDGTPARRMDNKACTAGGSMCSYINPQVRLQGLVFEAWNKAAGRKAWLALVRSALFWDRFAQHVEMFSVLD